MIWKDSESLESWLIKGSFASRQQQDFYEIQIKEKERLTAASLNKARSRDGWIPVALKHQTLHYYFFLHFLFNNLPTSFVSLFNPDLFSSMPILLVIKPMNWFL